MRVVLCGIGQTSHGLLLQKKKDLEESLLVFASGIFCFKAYSLSDECKLQCLAKKSVLLRFKCV